MRSLATIFVIYVILHFVDSQKCKTQGDCTVTGKRCVYSAKYRLAVACEVMPNNAKKHCRCRTGCLMCVGGGDGGFSRFIKQGKRVRTGCGLNTCSCRDASTNSYGCTLIACNEDDVAWWSHCPGP